MIGGIDLKWWLGLIAWGGATVCFGGALIDSMPFVIIGAVIFGWAIGAVTMLASIRSAAKR